MYTEMQLQEKFYDYIESSIIKNNKLSHAYLIEINNNTNYMNIIKDFIYIILSMPYKEDKVMQEKLKKQIYEETYPDLKFIKPEESWIKKEQLITLEKEFSKKSMLDNKLIYVIDKAEDLNDSSANTILKFLEEPENDIIAILVTNNKYKVLETIVSRCQKLSLINNSLEENKLDETMESFIISIVNNEELIINFDEYLEKLFLDKESSKCNISILNEYFCYCLEQNTVLKKSNNLLKDIDTEKILKYISIFNEFNDKLQYNINLKLWLTNFLIKIMEVS